MLFPADAKTVAIVAALTAEASSAVPRNGAVANA